ncbi:MAG: sigma factor-like helix-turn-helix DNA-binding protein [Eubacteriales bacterium]|nr:sigma factor-like helix-turn-helix DNA-binding protein [Eubacteriales bacterium]MDD3882952.1 sigma factor-like helix-turn-helix DNA-binding protein [Eubacteriales bacterium]MDD4513501.1 sigma factor-like helix-turn-helix DNA-binding protein [Eubacteriales bacterium]
MKAADMLDAFGGDEVEKRLALTKLMDAYGALLTEKQAQQLSMTLNEDLSLSEIAEETGTSRQAVYDSVHRSCRQLCQAEEKLGFIAKRMDAAKKLSEISALLEKGNADKAAAIVKEWKEKEEEDGYGV